MNDLNIHFDSIEAYLFGQMSEEQAAEFERQIASDPKLAEAVAIHRLEHRGMQILREQSLRSQMADWLKEDSSKTSGSSDASSAKRVSMWTTRRIFLMGMAASFLLLAGYFLFLQTPAYDPQQLASNYYPKPDMSGLSRDVEQRDLEDPMVRALDAMLHQQYAQAESLLKTVPASHPNSERLPLYLGDCQFRQGNLDAALGTLQPLLSSQKESLQQEAEFRVMLLLLHQKKTESAEFKTLFQKITGNVNHFGNKPTVQMAKSLDLK